MKISLSITEAAKAIGVSRTSIYELINAGKIKSIKIGARRLVPVKNIHEFIETCERVEGYAQ